MPAFIFFVWICTIYFWCLLISSMHTWTWHSIRQVHSKIFKFCWGIKSMIFETFFKLQTNCLYKVYQTKTCVGWKEQNQSLVSSSYQLCLRVVRNEAGLCILWQSRGFLSWWISGLLRYWYVFQVWGWWGCTELQRVFEEIKTTWLPGVQWSTALMGKASQEAAEMFWDKKRWDQISISLLVLFALPSNLHYLLHCESNQACILKFSFGSDKFLSNALITTYMKTKSVQNGWGVFNAMNSWDSTSWNSLLSGSHDPGTYDQWDNDWESSARCLQKILGLMFTILLAF